MLQVEIGVARIVVVVDEVPAAEIVGKAVAIVVDGVRLPPAPAFTGIVAAGGPRSGCAKARPESMTATTTLELPGVRSQALSRVAVHVAHSGPEAPYELAEVM